MELYVCMKQKLQNIKDGHFVEDTSLLDAIDSQDPHYMAMRTDSMTYTGKRYQVVNKDHKEDDIQRNFFCCFVRCVMLWIFLDFTFHLI